MNRFRPHTLRGRLALIALVASALWIAVLTASFNLALDKRLGEQADEVLRTRAEAVAATVEVRPDGRLTIHEPAQDSALDAGVWIYQGNRAIERPPRVPASLQREADQLAGRGPRFADSTTPSAGRLHALPVDAPGGHRPGGHRTHVDQPRPQPQHGRVRAGRLDRPGPLLLLGSVYLLTRLVVRRALRPVADMSAQAAEWSQAGTAERFGSGNRPSELASLAASLDELLDRLAAVLRHEQQQAAYLSHELRTPLARIVAETEWLDGRPRTPDEQNASHAAIANAADTMRQIRETLLAESRARSGQVPGRCYFPEVAHDLALRSAAEHPDAPVIQVRGGPATAGVSAALAERILSPLLDNARRHALHSIAIECATVPGTVRVSVVDDGPGVPETFVPSLFEPGMRAVSGDGHDGAGLGLALARRLARAAGGDITLDTGGTGARFIVESADGLTCGPVRGPSRSVCANILPGACQMDDQPEDDREEQQAGTHRPQAEPTVRTGLGRVVPEGGSEGARENVRDPERPDGAEVERTVSEGHRGDQGPEDEGGNPVPEAQPLGGEVTRGHAQGEGEQDRQPVEDLTPAGVDGVDGQRALAHVPGDETPCVFTPTASRPQRLSEGDAREDRAETGDHTDHDIGGGIERRAVLRQPQRLVTERGVRRQRTAQPRTDEQQHRRRRRPRRDRTGHQPQHQAAQDIDRQRPPREDGVMPALHGAVRQIPQRGADRRPENDQQPVHRLSSRPTWRTT